MNNVIVPMRMRKLPKDRRGYLVPWFVQWMEDGRPCAPGEGEPDFRVIDRNKFYKAIKQRLCWLCGEPLGSRLAFVIGPMCTINRVTSEPPSHRDCALYALQVCPFMTHSRMRRNVKDLPTHKPVAGFHVDHNPGAMALWITRDYEVFRARAGEQGVLLQLGPPESISWWAEGRAASREEIDAAIAKGLPKLRELAQQEGPAAVAALDRQLAVTQGLLP